MKSRTRRILFFGAGNCSFEKAYCQSELTWEPTEVVITAYEKLDQDKLDEIKAQIQSTIPEYGKNSVTISIYDQVCANNNLQQKIPFVPCKISSAFTTYPAIMIIYD